MHALYFSSSTVVGNAGNVVIGCQGSQSEFSSLISDWLELWHIVTLGCVEQASRRHLESTEGGNQGSKLVKRCMRKRKEDFCALKILYSMRDKKCIHTTQFTLSSGL